MYEYRCQVIRVVDGDTLWLDVDLGIDHHTRLSVRLFGVNAPEMSTDEGIAARMFVEDWIADHDDFGWFILETVKDRREKYGRYLATLRSGELTLNQALLDEGHAVPYSP